MAEEEYNKKLESLQKYIPFLNNMITQLRDPSRKNREQQLSKMESLHAMITDKKKKFKLETLAKCENVIIKLYEKVNHKPVSSGAFSPMTPASPSPPREIHCIKPVVIPTEKVSLSSASVFQRLGPVESRQNHLPKVDVYSSAAKSLSRTLSEKDSVFNRLGTKLPDMTKPPISLDDLKTLEQDTDDEEEDKFESASLTELTVLREKLAKEIVKEETKGVKINDLSNINTTVRNSTVPVKKVSHSEKQKLKSPTVESSSSSDSIKFKESSLPHGKSSKSPKILKESDCIFGSLLSSLDNKLLEGKKKDKKEERRSSINQKEDKKHDFIQSPKYGEHKDHRESVKRHEHKTPEYKSNKALVKRADCSTSNISSKPFPPKEERKNSYDSSSPIEIIDISDEKAEKQLPKGPFKRLADKFNPKPRKNSIEIINLEKDSPEQTKKRVSRFDEILPASQSLNRFDGPSASYGYQDRQNQQIIDKFVHIPNNAGTSINTLTQIHQTIHTVHRQQHSIISPMVNANMPPSLLGNNAHGLISNREFNMPGQYLQQNQFLTQNNPILSPNGSMMGQTNQTGQIVSQNAQFQNVAHFPGRNAMPAGNFGPNQFEANHQQYDYYGSTTPMSSFNTAGPQLLGVQREKQTNYFGNYNSMAQYGGQEMPVISPDPRGGNWVRETVRDPRVNRDPRSYKEYKEMKEKEKQAAEARNKWNSERPNRDPRQRGQNETWNTNKSRQENRFDKTYSNPSSSNNNFDSLYSGGQDKRTGKDYGMQSFRIPKKKNEENHKQFNVSESENRKNDRFSQKDFTRKKMSNTRVPEEEDWDDEYSNNQNKNIAPLEENWDDDDDQCSANQNKSTARVPPVEENWDDEDENRDFNTGKNNDENWDEEDCVVVPTKTKEKSKPSVTKKAKKKKRLIEDSDDEDDDENVGESAPSTEKNILFKFFANLMGKENKKKKKGALLSLISSFSDSIGEKQIQRISNIIEHGSESEEDDDQETKTNAKETESRSKDSDNKEKGFDAPEQECNVKRPAKRGRKPSIVSTTTEEGDKEEVHVSISERIKNRKKETPAKPKKNRTELDRLHEDIQEMFIRDGVLTATGKRMCRMLKDDPNALTKTNESFEPKKRPRPGPKSKTKVAPAASLKSMSNVRVVLSKIPDDFEDKRRSLRNSKQTNYAEEPESPHIEEQVEGESEHEDNSVMDEESDDSEKSKSLDLNKKAMKRKRNRSWASGFIKKSKKKKSQDQEETEENSDKDSVMTEPTDSSSEISLVEPDKSYYYVKTKAQCKLCSFSGRFLSNHYKQKHPQHEVLNSRLSPEDALIAIQDYEENQKKYEEQYLEITNDVLEFCCRFCGYKTKGTLCAFYDHVSLHTGEFRHFCHICTYSSNHKKTLHKHYSRNHTGTKINYVLEKLNKKILFGYMCSECNFLQIKDESVQKHIKNYHSNVKSKIYKINFSSLQIKDTEVETAIEDEDVTKNKKRKITIESDENKESPVFDGIPKKRAAKEKAEEKLKEIHTVLEKGVVNKKGIKEEKDETSKLTDDKQVENLEKNETEPIKPKVDLNVFTCKTDMMEENKKIEKERLQLMEELNKVVGTRNSLNFVEKLSNRLLKDDVSVKSEVEENAESNPNPTTQVIKDIPIKTEVVEPSTSDSSSVPHFKKHTMENNFLPHTALDVSEKQNTYMSGLLEKLQGVISKTVPDTDGDTPEDFESDSPPPMTHIQAVSGEVALLQNESTITLDVDLIKVYKLADKLTYYCHVPPCTFYTEDKNVFEQHCNEHKSISQNSAKCKMCNVEIKGDPLVEILFLHVLKTHGDFLNLTPTKVIRMRKLSGDLLSLKNDAEKDQNEIVTPMESGASTNEEKKETGNKEIPAESQEIEKPKTPPKVSIAELSLEGDNPFPFKIAGVVSLAEPSPPPLTPILMKKATSIYISEHKMTTAELAKPKKTKAAMTKLLKCLSDLYKCPYYNCSFSTTSGDFFDCHLKSHKEDPQALIPCIYCDVKTTIEEVKLHILVRHAHCRYACSYCLYRAFLKEYVMAHQDEQHVCEDYSVETLAANKSGPAITCTNDPKIRPKALCIPFRCVKGCDKEFLFENDFKQHLTAEHTDDSVQLPCGFKQCIYKFSPSLLPSHWSKFHSVHVFQCAFCKFSASDIKCMIPHFAVHHQNVGPDILYRNGPLGLGCGPDAFNHLKHIYSFNVQNIPKLESFPKFPLKVYSSPKVTSASSSPSSNASLTSVPSPSQLATSVKSVFLPSPNLKIGSPTKTILLPTSMISSSISSTQPLIKVVSPQKILKSPIRTENVINDEKTPDSVFTNVESNSGLTVLTSNNVDEPLVELEDDVNKSSETELDPLALEFDGTAQADNSSNNVNPEEENDSKGGKNKGIIPIGLMGLQLYRCICDLSFLNSATFKKHLMTCVKNKKDDLKPYECVHCGRLMRNPSGLVDHIQNHGLLRFSCSLCDMKFTTNVQVRTHIKSKHNITKITFTPLDPQLSNIESDQFIVRPKMTVQSEVPKETAIKTENVAVPSIKMEFGPDQIGSVPMRSIFSSPVKCGICSYATKVRTNLVRHLQFHLQEKSVPDAAPVNPVPCLEKNEKMFDKMTNLAISSFSGRMGSKLEKTEVEEIECFPEFIPTHSRYVCCAEGCNYLCPEEANLRHHLIALHDGETMFKCAHCKLDLTPTDADNLMKHFKLHGLHLYKCGNCKFLHNLKHKVERHITESHPNVTVKITTIRCLETEPQPVELQEKTAVLQNSGTKIVKPYRCCMCKSRSNTLQEIQQHVLNKHNMDSQFKCALCNYKSNDENTFDDHFKELHQPHNTDIIYFFRKVEDEKKVTPTKAIFDTTPLWQRDRPRVRHIRGILFDESAPAMTKSLKKSGKVVQNAATVIPSTSNLILSIDAVAKGTADILKVEETAAEPDIIEFINNVNLSADDIALSKESEVIVIDDLLNDVDDLEGQEFTNPDDWISEEDENSYDKDFSPSTLIAKYGQFGVPSDWDFLCPFCNIFKFKQLELFITHVFKELKYCRYSCNKCSKGGSSSNYMFLHTKKEKGCSLANFEVTIDEQLEVWVRMLVYHQSRIIWKNNKSLVGSIVPVTSKISCKICHIKLQDTAHLVKHEHLHWSQKPFGCGDCSYTSFVKQNVQDHYKVIHPKIPFRVRWVTPTIDEVIKQTNSKLLKSHGDLQISSNKNLLKAFINDDIEYNEPSTSGVTSKSELEPTEDLTEDNIMIEMNKEEDDDNNLAILMKSELIEDQESLYFCMSCANTAKTKQELIDHYVVWHNEKPKGKIKEVKKLDTVACAHCSYVDDELKVRQHHLKTHRISPYKPLKYICSWCKKRFSGLGYLRGHNKFIHKNMEVKYELISKTNKGQHSTPPVAKKRPEKASPVNSTASQKKMKVYQCTFCNYKTSCVNTANIRFHLQSHFSPFSCGICGKTFKAQNLAKKHFDNEHSLEPENIIVDAKKREEFFDVLGQIAKTASAGDGSSAKVESKVTQTARKSTATPVKSVTECSISGNKPKSIDLKKIVTTVELNKITMTMTAEQLSNIFNLFPNVEVENCNSNLES